MDTNIVSVGRFVPYGLRDLSVVIPTVAWHQRRISWFIPQYIQATPAEVIENTIVAYDGDEYTKQILEQYSLKGIIVSPDWSTYKQEAGFKEVRTRLCVRIHNDAYFPRNDWAQSLISQFNADNSPQLIGAFHPSGVLTKEQVDRILKKFPFFENIYKNLLFDNNAIGSPFLSAYFTAGQSYIFKSLYPIVMEINENKMEKEDCFLTIISSIFNIKIISWNNLDSFVIVVGKPSEFEEEVANQLPKNVTIVNESNYHFLSKAEFKEIHSISSG